MKNVLITGGKGQLATCIKDISGNIEGYNFIFVDVDELDIAKLTEVDGFFSKKNIKHCINCAAYTAVDKAESNQNLAELINVQGVRNLAQVCSKNGATLIHISTDFVFDGNQTKLYSEEDRENPLGVYGETKLKGEKEVTAFLKRYFIIRTSWLYSEHGDNFLKTMLRLGSERNELGVVTDQIGTPTYAGDLAKLAIDLVVSDRKSYGIYHFSNEGVASWYDFAKAIFDESKTNITLLPIMTDAYPTPAKRPKFSVMDKSKTKETLKIRIPHWRDSLKECLTKMID